MHIIFQGDGIPSSFELEITFDMDSSRVVKRAKLLERETNKLVNKISMNVTLYKGKRATFSQTVYLKMNDYGDQIDVFTPVSCNTVSSLGSPL